MTQLERLLVRRTDPRQTEVETAPLPVPAAGEVLMAIEGLALTANNVTYAVLGERTSYWAFFPAPEGWGCVPAWGFARVLHSAHPEVVEGTRYYGFWPCASHVLLQPGANRNGHFLDQSAHRSTLASIYNQYLDSRSDPLQRAGLEAFEAVLRPLYTTSFLLAHFLKDLPDGKQARTVVLTSASSKTALGTAFALRAAGVPALCIGLTSPRQLDFVRATGLYDRVLDYTAVAELAQHDPTISLDFAGNGAVLAEIHARCPNLQRSFLIGGAHWEQRQHAGGRTGVQPEIFFAPQIAADYVRSWGASVFQQKLAESWWPWLERMRAELHIISSQGMDALQQAWLQVVDQRVDGTQALYIQPGTGGSAS